MDDPAQRQFRAAGSITEDSSASSRGDTASHTTSLSISSNEVTTSAGESMFATSSTTWKPSASAFARATSPECVAHGSSRVTMAKRRVAPGAGASASRAKVVSAHTDPATAATLVRPTGGSFGFRSVTAPMPLSPSTETDASPNSGCERFPIAATPASVAAASCDTLSRCNGASNPLSRMTNSTSRPSIPPCSLTAAKYASCTAATTESWLLYGPRRSSE